MRICKRPRTSSSVTREIESSQINYNSNKNIKFNNDENLSTNKFGHEEGKRTNRINTQRRQLHPPNFQVSYNIESISNSNFLKQSFDKSKETDSNLSLSIKKSKNSSMTKRSQSETRQKKEVDSYQNKYSNDNFNLKAKNKKYDKDTSNLYLSKKNQNETSKTESQKITSRQNEYKNSDGSIKKLSEKFRCLSKQSNNDINDDDYFYQTSTASVEFYSYFSKSNDSNLIDYSSRNNFSKTQEETDNLNINSYQQPPKFAICNNDSYQSISRTKEINKNQSNEKIYDSIEIAMNRIKKEINEKDPVPKGVKPVISKRKRSLMNEKEQTSKSIDFEFLNDEPCIKEQINRSTIEKPHVSFMNSIQPPKKKNNTQSISNENFENAPSCELFEPTDQDFTKKITNSINYIEKNKPDYKSRKPSQNLPQNQEIDEFIQMEKKMKEEVDDDKGDVIPNFLKIIKILRDQLDKSQYQEVIRIMNKNKSKHFLLLLTQPLMNIDAVYVMRGDLKFASLLWGYGPEKVTKNLIDQFWKYNVTTKLFDDQQLGNFEPNLDAISIIKKH